MSIFSSDEQPIDCFAEQEATDESVGYEVKGYELHSEEFLVCPSCNKKLVSLLVVKKDVPVFEDFDTAYFIAECPKCKTESFKKGFHRVKLFLQAIEPFTISDMDTFQNQTKIILK